MSNSFCSGIFAKVWLTGARKHSHRQLKQKLFKTNIFAFLSDLSNPFFDKFWSTTILCSHCDYKISQFDSRKCRLNIGGQCKRVLSVLQRNYTLTCSMAEQEKAYERHHQQHGCSFESLRANSSSSNQEFYPDTTWKMESEDGRWNLNAGTSRKRSTQY